MWNYQIIRGWMDKDGILVSKTCYSGIGEGLNNPAMEAHQSLGPIPQGEWTISSNPFTGPHGQYCLRLYPKPGTETFGRDGFLIHGDEIAHPGEHLASHGCIIADRVTRERIFQSGDKDLTVIPGDI